ncbi:hypothetical protein EYF80_041709 [Liparis tanakae]|uniref:Uncharacterized protein n=1 Tax=Liparis tanakae TaxID=230148 RepID=A0A4Z2G5N7_9TELE|nr:hypothetical protein EYF80_041709 [Liparis tanakae]
MRPSFIHWSQRIAASCEDSAGLKRSKSSTALFSHLESRLKVHGHRAAHAIMALVAMPGEAERERH